MSGDLPAQPRVRDRMAALRYLPAFLRMIWATHRGYTAAVVVLRVIRAGVPLATLYAARLILDEVVAATRGEGDPAALWRYVALEIAFVAAGELLARASALAESMLGDLFSNRVSLRLMEHAGTLSLEQFEDPEFYDYLERARVQTNNRAGLLAQLMAVAQDALTLATLGGAILVFNVWLGLLLLLAVLPGFLSETHFAGLEYSLLFRFTPERRRLGYLRVVASSDQTAKEVQMFGLSPWLTERYRRLADQFYVENRRLSLRRAASSSLLALVGTAGYYGAYVFVLNAAVNGTITVGQLAFLAASFGRSRDLIHRVLQAASDVGEQCLYLRDLFVFFDMKPRIVSGTLPVPATIREGFHFDGVGFRYPGRERWAVRGISLRLRPGECVALVGENGAGKTTLTKLLGRLYDPTEGRITLDGVDLREYDLASLRRAIGVIFQDFTRYDMRFDENIAVGGIHGAAEYLEDADRRNGAGPPPVPHPIRAAAEESLASALLPRFPGGYRQMLGKLFDGGVDLSGGEWQKIALARAYMREDAAVRILDEPTAALDARAEYEIFARFRELTRGRMAVIISHRFSTVRMADRIMVLRGGAPVEEGTHAELVERGGLYAELFELQAAGYR